MVLKPLPLALAHDRRPRRTPPPESQLGRGRLGRQPLHRRTRLPRTQAESADDCQYRESVGLVEYAADRDSERQGRRLVGASFSLLFACGSERRIRAAPQQQTNKFTMRFRSPSGDSSPPKTTAPRLGSSGPLRGTRCCTPARPSSPLRTRITSPLSTSSVSNTREKRQRRS